MTKLNILDSSEKKIYVACLKLGSSTMIEIARESGINRATCYGLVDRLIKKGLITYFIKGKKRLFRAVDPNRLFELAERQVKQAENDKLKLQKLVPGWEEMYYSSSVKPRVQFFEGLEGIKQVYEDTLKQRQGSEILGYASVDDLYKYLPKFTDNYIRRRVKHKISARGILPETDWGRKHVAKHKRDLVEFKFISPKFSFRPEVNIYHNKVAFMSYGDEFVGVIVESKEIYNYHKQMFELLWGLL